MYLQYVTNTYIIINTDTLLLSENVPRSTVASSDIKSATFNGWSMPVSLPHLIFIYKYNIKRVRISFFIQTIRKRIQISVH